MLATLEELHVDRLLCAGLEGYEEMVKMVKSGESLPNLSRCRDMIIANSSRSQKGRYKTLA
jgi:hypothetical protein